MKTSDGIRTGAWCTANMNAAPKSPRSKHPYPTVVVRFAVSRDDCTHEGKGTPKKDVVDRLVTAPLRLARAEARIAVLEAALSRWGAWCHSPDDMDGELFEAAVEGTPAECFPAADESGGSDV